LEIDLYMMALGLFSGAVGGIIAALYTIFDGFKSLEGVPSDNSDVQRNKRMVFFIIRIVYGALLIVPTLQRGNAAPDAPASRA